MAGLQTLWLLVGLLARVMSSHAADSTPLSLESQRALPVWNRQYKGEWTCNVANAFGIYTVNHGRGFFICESLANSTALSTCSLALFDGEWSDDDVYTLKFTHVSFDTMSNELTLFGMGSLEKSNDDIMQTFEVDGALRYSGGLSPLRLSGSIICGESTRFFITFNERTTESIVASIQIYCGVVIVCTALLLLAYFFLWRDCKASQRLAVQLSPWSLTLQVSTDTWLLFWHLLLLLTPASNYALMMILCSLGSVAAMIMVLMEVWRQGNMYSSQSSFVCDFILTAVYIMFVAVFVMIFKYRVMVVFLSFFYVPQIYSNAQNREPNKMSYLTYVPLGASRLLLLVRPN